MENRGAGRQRAVCESCGLNMLLLAHYTSTPEWKAAEALQLQASESMAFGKAAKGHKDW